MGELTFVVVGPALVAGVVGRINVDALHLAGVGGQEGLEGAEVVAVDDDVVVQAGGLARALGLDRRQLMERHHEVVVLDEGFAFEGEGGHRTKRDGGLWGNFRRPETKRDSLVICAY
jgi:hypothetical protein